MEIPPAVLERYERAFDGCECAELEEPLEAALAQLRVELESEYTVAVAERAFANTENPLMRAEASINAALNAVLGEPS